MDSREYTFEGKGADIDESAAVSRESTLVGDVTVGPDVTVWPGAVLRGDVGPVELAAGSAIGDNAVLHASTVGESGMVGHGAVLNDSHRGSPRTPRPRGSPSLARSTTSRPPASRTSTPTSGSTRS